MAGRKLIIEAALNEFVPNESDAYTWFNEALARFFEEALSHPSEHLDTDGPARRVRVLDLVDREVPPDFESLTGGILPPAELLGRRVGELHVSLASIDAPAFAPEAMNALARYHWPGNIRELQNFIERAVILSTGSTLHVPVRELKGGPVGASVVTLEAAEREAIQRALHDAGGKVGGPAGAASKLGMKRTTLQAKMRKLGIDTKSF